MTKIKICGLYRPEDIRFVNEIRPDFCGFIIHFPKSHRSLSVVQVRALREHLCDAVIPVGVFVNQPAQTVAQLLNDGVISIAQLHGDEDEAYITRVRELTGDKPVWKAFRVRTPSDLTAAEVSTADHILLDNGTGTGLPFDWSILDRRDGFREKQWILAGGLTPETIPNAVRRFHPWCVDVSGGVETERVKDPQKIRAAVTAAHGV